MRRLRGSLLAVVLTVGVLVTTNSSATAANTAAEFLYDHDASSETIPVRRFAGPTRYLTSVDLAEAYMEFVGRGSFDTVIVVSGISLVDAAAGVGLAALKAAPVLLNRTANLSTSVKNFISNNDITKVYILGETTAISQNVEDALNALPTVSAVTRFGGPDRYATSAIVARELGSYGDYCGSGETTAIVVNANNEVPDVIAAGPLAYSQEIPILLTSSDGLSPEVTAFLEEGEIDRVVVVGGTTSVPDSVVAQIEATGILTVSRLSGDTRFGTAVAVRTALENCAGVVVEPNHFALVNGDAIADGVSAAAYLGTGNNAVGVIPVLLVTPTGAPSETRQLLSSIPVRNSQGTCNHVSLTAIGGTEAVTPPALAAAVDAAITSVPLTATISVKAGSATAKITFSSPVDATQAMDKANYKISGFPLLPSDTVTFSGNVVTITLGSGDTFIAGSEITIVEEKITGVGCDDRPAVSPPFTVPPAGGPDRSPPRVEVFAAEDAYEFRVVAKDVNLVDTGELTDGFDISKVVLNGELLINNPGFKPNQFISPPNSGGGSLLLCLNGFRLNSPSSLGLDLGEFDDQDDPEAALEAELLKRNPNPACLTPVETQAGAPPPKERLRLAVGDVITLAAGAFVDASGNRSRAITERVTANPPDGPRTTRVTVSNDFVRNTGTAAAPIYQNAVWSWTNADVNLLSITSKSDGEAAGARGNEWSVSWELVHDTAGGGADNTAPSASATVLEARRVIRIVFDDDAKLFDVAQALLANAEVTKNFDVASAALVNVNSDTINIDLEPIFSSTHTVNAAHQGVPGVASNGATAGGTTIADTAFVASRNLEDGVSSVTVIFTHNSVLETFTVLLLAAENAISSTSVEFGTRTCDSTSSDEFPPQENWNIPSIQVRSIQVVTFDIYSSCLAWLPAVGDTFILPRSLAVNYNRSRDLTVRSPATEIRLVAG